jgi:hypothetical protein
VCVTSSSWSSWSSGHARVTGKARYGMVPFKVITMPRLLLPTLLTCIVSSAAAQIPAPSTHVTQLRPGWARAVWAPAQPDHRLGLDREPLGGFLGPGDEDYRYPGFFIGAGLGLAATLFSVAWCSDADNACSRGRALLLGPILTGAFGLGGAVIGGLIPKSPPPSAPGGA